MYKRNRFTFGIGTIGRDMVYTLISTYLIFYLSNVINLPVATFAWVSVIIVAIRIFDVLNDPFMGFVVDNTRTKWGKFKPWIAFGGTTTAIFTVLIFTDFGLTGTAFIVVFTIAYLFWGICYTTNDIAYWSMLPALSDDQKEREKIGVIARICANIGLFFVVAGIVPITAALGESFGSLQMGYFVFTVIIAIVMVAGLLVTLFGVKESNVKAKIETTSIKEMFAVIFKNDQLLYTAIAMSLFMIGYVTTTAFGLFYFEYAYGNIDMFPIFAIILGISQITALAVFPLFSKKYDRRTLYTFAMVLIAIGYVIFFFAPTTTMIFIGIAGVFLFFGQSFVQLLMLMFLADTVDYGHWKLGKRNESITFSLQPLINKTGGAVSSGVVSVVVILSGIVEAESAADVTESGLLILRMAMFAFPLLCIIVSYLIYRKKYVIDSKFYTKIQDELAQRNSQ
ncbi:MAG: glycoside-pentoside-hexuronide (GPH):cation symporter [Firmicutes bacterium]|nr:glycoside-pentoside-hexuronide (GPH):cation symporter [Bacillota bacterium]